jgi:PPM family protein phosphatase
VPLVVGAAGERKARRRLPRLESAAGRAAALRHTEDDDTGEDETHRPRRWPRRAAVVLVVLALLSAGVLVLRQWGRGQYYVGVDHQRVAIYQGVAAAAGALKLSHVYQHQAILLADLPVFEREQVRDTITARGLADAHRIVDRLQQQAQRCIAQRAGTTAARPATRTATGTAPGATAAPSAGPTQAASTPGPTLLDCGDGTP